MIRPDPTMAPKTPESDVQTAEGQEDQVAPVITNDGPVKQKNAPTVIVWRNVTLMGLLHLGAIYAIVLIPRAHILTLLWTFALYLMNTVGITAGSHRLWAHRTYKARLPLRILLAYFTCIASQNHVYEWARDHRVHHKYSETDADPHNATRGFFFSHIGWLLVRKHPDVRSKGQGIDLSDLKKDPVVMFQKKYYLPLMIMSCFVIPTVVPWYFWGESLWNAYFLCALFRYCLALNATWLVNSAAHMWGNRPYDATINPVENLGVSFGAVGEGFHNYHHTFPQDYSASEFGWKVNLTTAFIDFMAFIGQAYDRRRIPREIVKKRMARTGDGTH